MTNVKQICNIYTWSLEMGVDKTVFLNEIDENKKDNNKSKVGGSVNE